MVIDSLDFGFPFFDLRSKMLLPFQIGEIRVLAQSGRQLSLCTMDFLASFASILAVQIHSSQSNSHVGVRDTNCRIGFETLRPMVHEREEIFVHRGQPHQPAFSDRKLGRSSGGGGDGLAGEFVVHVLSRNGTLLGAFCDALPEISRKQQPASNAEASVLLVLCSSKHGELGLELDQWRIRYLFENAVLSVGFSVCFPGFKANAFQKMYEEIHGGVVGLFFPSVGAGFGL